MIQVDTRVAPPIGQSYVYALLDAAGAVRYVGATSRALRHRLAMHRTLRPWVDRIVVLETVSSDRAALTEEHWIAYYGVQVESGEAGHGLGQKSLAWREKASRSLTGRQFSDETRRKMSESARKRAARDKEEGRVYAPLTQEQREKHAAAMKGRKFSPEAKARMSEMMRKRWADKKAAQS